MTREEAIKELRGFIGQLTEGCQEAIKVLIPELTESEDERIRKFLIQHISEWIGCIEHDLKHSSKDIESEKELAMFKAGLAYLEKQKESLPISETCKENANSFTDGIIEVRSFQRGMEEGRKLEKQKEQNGEDGFLEDELSAFLQNYDKEYDDDAAVSDVARHFYEIGKKQNEQKPHTDEEKEYIRTIKSIISDFIRDKKPENLAYYQRIYDWLDGRHVPFSCSHENGEPADPVFSKQEYESHPIISKDTTSAKPAELDGKALLHTADKSYQIGFRDGVASVKQKCSAEDEEMLEYVIGDVNDAKQLFTTKEAIDLCDKEIAWLKSLRPSWKPSEEQMDCYEKQR